MKDLLKYPLAMGVPAITAIACPPNGVQWLIAIPAWFLWGFLVGVVLDRLE